MASKPRYLKDIPLTDDPSGSTVVLVAPTGFEARLPIADIADGMGLADVATSGDYNDLINTPGNPDASDVGFTPSDINDWDGGTDPGNTDGALDQLAERVSDIEGVGGSVTSVGVAGTDGLQVDSGSPITTAGTIQLGVDAPSMRAHLNVEDGSTADQTGAEIKSLYENEPNTNAFTDAEKSKLTGVEVGATADQTGAEIKSLYEAQANTNAFTDAEKSKLTGVEAGATTDQTGSEIKSLYEGQPNTNAYTDAEKSKLAGLDGSHFRGVYNSLAALNIAHPTGVPGDYAHVDLGVGQDVVLYIWDASDSAWIEQLGQSTAETAASIKTKYESNPDTNAYTDAEKVKVSLTSGVNTGDQDLSGLALLTDPRFTNERVPTSAGLTSKFGTAKGSIVDADRFVGLDSAASLAPKNWLWSTIKSTLKTYFDTLYNLYVLPVATTTTIGGVKRNTGGAGQYITGYDASGNALFDTPAGGDASDISFTPSVPADWTGGVDPGHTNDALDELADRIKALEGGGGGPGGGGVTGDLKYAMRSWSDPPEGWVVATGTIGNAISGATTRANADCKELFLHLWSAISALYAPVSGGKSFSALDDWEAGKTITIPDMRGRILLTLDGMGGGSPAGVVTEAGSGVDANWQGKPGGYQNHTLTVDEMPSHTHSHNIRTALSTAGGAANYQSTAGPGAFAVTTIHSEGGDQPHSNMPPVVPFPLFIKL